MSDQIRIRMYDVRFGDAILVTIPDSDESGAPLDRHVLIDVGNVLSGQGGSDAVFEDILGNIAAVTGDRGIDLYIATHEHMDHVQGLLHGATKADPPINLNIDTVWLTASADPTYYERFTEAKKHLDNTNAVYTAIARHLAASGEGEPKLMNMIENNNPRKTADCVEFLREHVTDAANVHYVHRGFDTSATQPFRDATFEILAPEEDTTEYYGRFRPMALGRNAGIVVQGVGQVVPPAGVDATSFYRLVEQRANGLETNVMAIDKAKNNTSVVFTIEWRGRKLLFSGDAEVRSWKAMHREGVLSQVDFLKVSHHGSHNGTPGGEILDAILLPIGIGNERAAALSTCLDTYNNVPDGDTTKELERRCDLVVSTQGVQGCVDILIPEFGKPTSETFDQAPV